MHTFTWKCITILFAYILARKNNVKLSLNDSNKEKFIQNFPFVKVESFILIVLPLREIFLYLYSTPCCGDDFLKIEYFIPGLLCKKLRAIRGKILIKIISWLCFPRRAIFGREAFDLHYVWTRAWNSVFSLFVKFRSYLFI